MADEIYRPQIDPRTAVAQPGADAEAFGAATARGLVAAGESIDRAVHEVRQKHRENEAAEAGVEMAQLSTDLDTAAVDARESAGPGGEGHADAVAKIADQRIADALGRIRDPRTRKAYEQRYAEIRGRIYGNEYAWEAGQRVAFKVENIDRQGTTIANGLATNPDPKALEDGLKQIETTIGEMDSLPASTKAKAVREQQRKAVVAWGNSMQDKDPHTLIATLDKGLLSPYLEPEDINTLRSGGMVEIRREEAKARQAKNDAEQEAREQISVFRKGVAAGAMPSDEEFDGLIAKAKGLGLTEQVADLALDKSKIHLNRETRDFTPQQFNAAINTLEAKGDKRSKDEDIRLAQLKAIAGPRIAQFNADPHAAAALAGHPAPSLEAGPDARIAWARGYAKSAGLVDVPYLSPAEMQPYKDRVGQGMVGTVEVASELRRTWGVNVGQQIMRQVAPGNADGQLLVGLPPVTAESVALGTKALANNGKLANNASAAEVFAEYRQAIPAELQDSVFRAAKAITARYAEANGVTDWADSDDAYRDAFRVGVQRAVGMVTHNGQSTGGMIRWNGRPAWLPQDMGRDDFQRKMSRAQADPQRFVKAAGAEPYYRGADGKLKPMTEEQKRYLGKYQLKTVAPGVYGLVGAQGGDVVGADGKPWLLDVRKLP